MRILLDNYAMYGWHGAKNLFEIEVMNIHFEKANASHIDTIFGWLAQPPIQEFWDNTQGHKDDILNFIGKS